MNGQAIKKKAGRLSVKIYIVLVAVVLGVYCVSLVLPLIWMFISSFKDEIDFTLNAFGWPASFNPDNYVIVMSLMKVQVFLDTKVVWYGFGRMLFYSMIRSTLEPLKQVFFSACFAYIMSKYKFFGNKFIYTLGIVIMIIPIYGNLPSAMLIRKTLGIYDNLAAIIAIPPALPFSGLHFLILYAACQAIPKDYIEAGFIDGAGHHRVMLQLILPMLIPVCATLFVLNFLTIWNDYESFLIWFPSTPNLALGMYLFQNKSTAGSAGATAPQVLAGFVIVMIPTAALYLSAQKLIVSKFTVGGLKG